MTVWVTQETDHDFTPAEIYGDVQFLTMDDFSNVRNSLTNKAIVNDIKHKLKKFDPEEDWLIITGSPYVSACTFMVLGAKAITEVNILRWDNRERTYRPLHIDISKRTED